MQICGEKWLDGSAFHVRNLIKLCEEGPINAALQSVVETSKKGLHLPLELFSCLIDKCIREKDKVVGKQVYSFILEKDLIQSTKLRCRLIVMFSSWGSISDALQVFRSTQEQNIYTWNSIIIAHAQNCLGQQAMELYTEMQMMNVEPSAHTFVGVIKACTNVGALNQGKVIHANFFEHNVKFDGHLGSALVDMYAKCGSIRDARCIFDRLTLRDVVVWSVMISSYAQHDDGCEALSLFKRMLELGIAPTRMTFVCSLKSCASSKAINEGKLIHAEITKQKMEGELIVGNILEDMYAKCGKLEDAYRVFEFLPIRDSISWNTLIAGLLEEESYEEAMNLCAKMQNEDLTYSTATLMNLLKLFAGIQDLQGVNLVCLEIICWSADLDIRLQNLLVGCYAKCGCLSEARKVFAAMQPHDIISWNTMLVGYVDHQLGDEALELFRKMIETGTMPDRVTFTAVLKACTVLETSESGKLVHILIVKQGLESDAFTASSVIYMYAKCQCNNDAHYVFDHTSMKNVVTWNAIITGYADSGYSCEALDLFATMLNDSVEPSRLTFLAVLKACASLAAVDLGRVLHFEVIEEDSYLDPQIRNSVLDLYAKCGKLEDVENVFSRLPRQDVVSWSTLLLFYVDHGFGEKALDFFSTMQKKGIEPNKVTFLGILKACTYVGTFAEAGLVHGLIMRHGFDAESSIMCSLIDMYVNCGSLIDARDIFNKLPQPNIPCYSAMIGGYADHDNGEEALKLFEDMNRGGLHPNEVTYLSVLKACASITSLNHGKLAHADVLEQGLDLNRSVGSTLVDMYAKCGSMDDALEVFDDMDVKDVVSWNAILGGYADHGHHEIAHKCFECMIEKGVHPNDVTFVSLLNACNHAGLFYECSVYLKCMIQDYGIEPTIKHYACLIDMYGRSGCLEGTLKMIMQLPIMPNLTVSLSLLSACAKFKNVEIGQRVFECVSKSGFWSPAGYVLMSNMFAANQFGEDDEQAMDAVSYC